MIEEVNILLDKINNDCSKELLHYNSLVGNFDFDSNFYLQISIFFKLPIRHSIKITWLTNNKIEVIYRNFNPSFEFINFYEFNYIISNNLQRSLYNATSTETITNLFLETKFWEYIEEEKSLLEFKDYLLFR